MKKYFYGFFLILVLVFTGCIEIPIDNNDEIVDLIKGIKVIHNEVQTNLIATENSEAISIKIDGIINASDITYNDDIYLLIVTADNNDTIISIASKEKIIYEGDILFSIKDRNEALFGEITEDIKTIKSNNNIYSQNKLLGDINLDNKIDLYDLELFSDTYLSNSNDDNYNVNSDIFPVKLGDGSWDGYYSKAVPNGIINLNDFLVFTKNFGKEAPIVNITLESITITGNSTVNIGDSLKLIATANYSDGSTNTNGINWESSNENIATINNGNINALKVGTSTITASIDNISDTFTITVKEKIITIEKIEITGTSQIKEGNSTNLTALVTYSNNTTNDEVNWTSSNNKIATITTNGKLTAIKEGQCIITASKDNKSKTLIITVNKELLTVSNILITGDNQIFENNSITLIATVTYSNYTTDNNVTWSSSNEDIATIDNNGVLNAIKEGNVTITATNDKSTNFNITVNKNTATVNKVVITGNNTVNEGKSINLIATVSYSDGSTNNNVTWTSSNQDIATIDNNGNLNAIKEGTVTITATKDNKSDTYNVSITASPVTVDNILITGDKSVEEGNSINLNAIVSYSDGSTDSDVNWTSSDEDIATIDNNGKLTAIKKGDITITATKDNESDEYNVSITASLVTIENISITGDKELEEGTSISLEATVTYSDGTTDSDVIWTSSDKNIASINSNGQVTGISDGNVIITASNGEIKDTHNITVNKIPESGITIYIEEGYGDQYYAWDNNKVTLSDKWPGTKLTTKVGQFYVAEFDSNVNPINYIILKNGAKVTGDELTNKTIWIDKNGASHDENPYKTKPSITVSQSGKLKGSIKITISISSFETNTAKASFENNNVAISSTGGELLVSDYLNDGKSGTLTIEASNSLGKTTASFEIERDDNSSSSDTGHPTIPSDQINNTIYQAFYWNSPSGIWNSLNGNIKTFSEIGVTSMWLPPAQKASGGTSSVGYDVYDLWDLGEFNQKGSTATKYGTKSQLDTLLNTMNQYNVEAYFDGVLNHRIGSDGQESFDGRTAWTKYTGQGRYKYYSRANDWDWDHNAFDGDSNGLFPGKSWDVNEDYLMGEDVDYENGNVQHEIKEWGQWIVTDANFDGFRLDAIKHIGNSFVKDFANAVKAVKPNAFIVGEAWIENVNDLKSYLSAVGNSIKVFDFPLRNDFVDMSNGGKDLRNWGGLVNSDKYQNAVTFVDNHDTCRDGNPYNKPQITRFKNQAYAYMLIQEKGTPCIFAKDYDDYGMKPSIDPIITARRYYAYGDAVGQQSNDSDVYSLVRKGLSNVPKTGCVLMISDGTSGNTASKSINSYKANTTYYDITGNIKEKVTTDSSGQGNFKVIQSEAKGWSIWVQE